MFNNIFISLIEMFYACSTDQEYVTTIVFQCIEAEKKG